MEDTDYGLACLNAMSSTYESVSSQQARANVSLMKGLPLNRKEQARLETFGWALLDYFRTSPAEFQAVDPEVLAQIIHS